MSESRHSSAELLESARAGDKQALEELLARHQSQIYRFGMKMCRDPEDAKDVLQDTLVAMARGLRDFQGASSLSTWLYSVARSFCLKKRRKSKHAPSSSPRSLESDSSPAASVVDEGKLPDEVLASKQVEQALEEAIAELEPSYREVLVLRDVEGLRAAEVAEILGIGIPAVKSRLHRARLALRARVAPSLGISPQATSPTPACPDVLELFSHHLEGEISADVCARMERHVEACERCRTACDSLKRTLSLCRSSATTNVPRHVQESVRRALDEVLAGQATPR
ncbi:RNA polymerase sigma-54 factor RpoN [Labilithrix luteola]|uniref:RNA polymerase sigma-54 factor RpoN n=1 Tax=Labilithrix luteola TaxID=1391654 RepID=A0A0K1PXN4_9BACT|nr:sigma-70 family RNA polymerase sigma factor [Labilithrix luteola]AKU98285.1 RNA polymerase sigma-54 factor RpoN [Labilithrix luteola]